MPQLLQGNTADKDAEVAPDANKDAAPVVAPEKVQEQAPATGAEATEEPKEEAPVDEKTVEEPVADTLVKSRLAAQPESTAVGEEIPTDVPADTETPVEPESTAADEKTPADVPAGTETPVDPAVVGDAQVETAALDGVETPDAVANGLLANAAIAPITPVDAPTTVTDEGNGWKYDKATTTLNINGQLDESDGTDKERWGGHTSEITTISVNTSVTAPKNSSYLFANMTKLTDIKDLNKLQFADADGINVTTSAKGMFRNDSSITSINLSQNNLYYIEDISHMFENDTSLETTIYPIKSPKMNIAHITDASYAYANDTSLVDPGVSDWQVHGIKNLTGMFKNDSNIENLNLKSWYEYPEAKPQTGDSSKGEGMFDGTNLETITINGSMRFDSETALTSTHGTMWVNSYTDPDHGITTPVTGKDFSGVPTFTNGVATGGIGSQFDGSGALDTKYTFAAQQAPAGSIITNIVSIPTNHEGVSIPVIAQGTAGEEITIDNADIPSTITIDGTVYTKQQSTDPIKAIISNSTSTNAESTVTYLGAQVDGGSVEVPITKNGENTGETITLSVDSGYAGGSTTITLDKQIPEGYELKDTSKDKVTITYNDSTTNPYTFSPTTIELVGTPNKVPTIKVNNPDGTETTWDIPAGNYGGKEQTVT
ncbi:BspA family leucine-rich repeat surface protein, partial [Companilactobacillus nodensis]